MRSVCSGKTPEVSLYGATNWANSAYLGACIRTNVIVLPLEIMGGPNINMGVAYITPGAWGEWGHRLTVCTLFTLAQPQHSILNNNHCYASSKRLLPN